MNEEFRILMSETQGIVEYRCYLFRNSYYHFILNKSRNNRTHISLPVTNLFDFTLEIYETVKSNNLTYMICADNKNNVLISYTIIASFSDADDMYRKYPEYFK